ncbi:hypothetical protein [Campylobacter sp. US33a]|uniref:hypothetical protein n=1 Tax=Campylobacter sp. US33a TaxID=2498120 RepID=UPI001068349A|nr:hypothetical protein [Campylobacter sp. US33a]TEY00372.1 hypothetical protein ELQ16_09330 [Campylobacter sp. US33a]
MKDFLSEILRALKQALNVEIYPLSREKEKMQNAFIIYEVLSEELILSLDDKILNKDFELNLRLYAPKYKDLRELKSKLEIFVLDFHKKPIEFLINGEEKDELGGFFMSEIFITYRL